MKLEKLLKDSFSGYTKKLKILSTLKMEFHCFLACIFAMEKSDVSLIVVVLWFISVFPPDTFKIDQGAVPTSGLRASGLSPDPAVGCPGPA